MNTVNQKIFKNVIEAYQNLVNIVNVLNQDFYVVKNVKIVDFLEIDHDLAIVLNILFFLKILNLNNEKDTVDVSNHINKVLVIVFYSVKIDLKNYDINSVVHLLYFENIVLETGKQTVLNILKDRENCIVGYNIFTIESISVRNTGVVMILLRIVFDL